MASFSKDFTANDVLVAPSIDEAYQPKRVLISVLLMPAAKTRIRTSPVRGVGVGTRW
jgi:hypothetical protein